MRKAGARTFRGKAANLRQPTRAREPAADEGVDRQTLRTLKLRT